MMSFKKLAAGSGYDYLTRQVAAQDATLPAGGLTSYYSERGEAPGTWVGSGLAALGLRPGDRVTAEQMSFLFGLGEHPFADQLRTAATAAGMSPAEITAAGRLGEPLRVRKAKPTDAFRQELGNSYRAWNAASGHGSRAKLPTEVKARLRTDLGREYFQRTFGRLPADEAELLSAVIRWSKPPKITVAGYDMTFSPPKSVSTMWALADPQLAGLIERCHQAAVRDALAFIEERVLFTRLGSNGVRQVDVKGLVAVAFTHRESRAGDPDLHTHVAIANKVQTLDGKWRAVDGRMFYKAHVASSEVYDTALAAHLTETLGVRMAPRASRGKHPVWEIDGIDPKLCKAWSSRRTAIEAKAADLATEFRADHGRPPTALETIHLAQTANLATRDAKPEPRTLAEQRASWNQQAETLLGPGGIQQMIHAALDPRAAERLVPTEAWAHDVARQVVTELEAGRAKWQVWHVRAEVLRQLRGLPIPTEHLSAVADRLANTVLERYSWRLDPADTDVPAELRRRDGQSVYTVAGAAEYSSSRVLAAEQRLLATAARTDARRIDPELVDLALLESVANGTTLNHGQADLVRAMATSGRRLQLAIAPAGTGNTTCCV